MKIEIRSTRELFRAASITACCSIVFSNILVFFLENYIFPPWTWDDIISASIVAGIASFIVSLFIFWQNLKICRIKDSLEELNSELVSTQSELEKQAITDSLTGLFNRRLLFQVMQREILRYERYKHPFCVMLLDLDHFKKVNDTFGHSVGDDALRAFSAVLKEVARQQDVVARTGGEEFCILLPEINQKEASQAAERIRKLTARTPLDISEYSVPLTVSIGISEIKANENADGIYQRADMALYKAKSSGRNRVELA